MEIKRHDDVDVFWDILRHNDINTMQLSYGVIMKVFSAMDDYARHLVNTIHREDVFEFIKENKYQVDFSEQHDSLIFETDIPKIMENFMIERLNSNL